MAILGAIFITNIVFIVLFNSPSPVVSIGAAFVGCIVNFVINASLVHGVSHNQPDLVRKWLIYFGTLNVLKTIGVFVGFVLACVFELRWGWIVAVALGGSVVVGMFWYWFMVVLHCYREMQEEAGSGLSRQVDEPESHEV